jgi:glutamyl-tRNA synthetase
LYNWLFARQHGGTFVLRVEDTDLDRSEKRYEQYLTDDLEWLGLIWDEGTDKAGPYGPYRQTDRLGLYQKKADELLEAGAAYYCFCSAEELEQVRSRQIATGQQPRYAGKCRNLRPEEAIARKKNGEPATLRFKVREGKVEFRDLVFGLIEVDCSVIGDFILLRSNGTAQYNFAVVVDDLSMEITHVIRGEGHISNTHRQLLVYEALGGKAPQFAHLSTILGKDGTKLSKRHGSASIDQFRKEGYLPQGLVNYLSLLGWAPEEEGREILSVAELISEFDLGAVNRSPAVFDMDKLKWVNRSHLKELSVDRLVELVLPYLQQEGWVTREPSAEVLTWLGDVVTAVLGHLDRASDIVSAARLVFDFNPERDLEVPEVREMLSDPVAEEVVRAFVGVLDQTGALDSPTFKEVVRAVKEKTGQKGKQLFHPIRVALTCRMSGPELDKLVPIFEKGKNLSLPQPIVGPRARVRQVLSLMT